MSRRTERLHERAAEQQRLGNHNDAAFLLGKADARENSTRGKATLVDQWGRFDGNMTRNAYERGLEAAR